VEDSTEMDLLVLDYEEVDLEEAKVKKAEVKEVEMVESMGEQTLLHIYCLTNIEYPKHH
jgi:hypothetical protein